MDAGWFAAPMRLTIASGIVAVVLFAISRVIAVGPKQGDGYRRRRELAWSGPKRYRTTAPIERGKPAR